MKTQIILPAAYLVAISTVFGAGESGPQLGAPDFKPTPQYPVGWRGDWTGRYPGATPPTTWSRKVKGITSEIKIQARKPTGEPGADARPLEYFTVKDWLVAGPFDAPDPVKDIDRDFLGGEAGVQPNEGDKAGETAWKYHCANAETQVIRNENFGGEEFRVDYLYLYGKFLYPKKDMGPGDSLKIDKEPENKIAYAHTYIYAPRESDVGLIVNYDALGIKVWLNGRALELAKTRDAVVTCQLIKGWNRLLVKSSCDHSSKKTGDRVLSNWRFAAYLTSSAKDRNVSAYETKNIAWMTKVRLAGQSMSQPTVLGDRLFLGSGRTDFLCINKADGKVLWIKTVTHWDLMGEAERATVKARVEPALNELGRLNLEITKAINEMLSPQGADAKQQQIFSKLLKEKQDIEKKVHNEFLAVDAKKYAAPYDNEISCSVATPVCDGKYIYWACGGVASFGILCFEPDGKIVWGYRGYCGIYKEHGRNSSPLFIDGKIIFNSGDNIIGIDARNGVELWKTKGIEGCRTPVPARIGKEAVAIVNPKQLWVLRVADGALLCRYPTLWPTGVFSTVIEDGVVYFPGRKPGLNFVAAELPSSATANADGKILWEIEGAELYGGGYSQDSNYIASPLYVNGLLYQVAGVGQLFVMDTAAKKLGYRQNLDGYNRYHRSLFGICASPALGGKYIFITDDAGYTMVVEPGREFKVVAHNALENMGGGNGPCGQETFYAAPTFDGNSIYLRGSDYLYCIREK